MAYTIIKSDGTQLTTVPDGTMNTTSTSVGLFGRNYAGYGQTMNTNFVKLTENFASSTPPANPIRGQLWFDINSNTLKVCPENYQTNPTAWLTLSTTADTGTTTFGTVTVTGDLYANNATVTNDVTSDEVITRALSVSATASISAATITTGNIATVNTKLVSTGSTTESGTMIGVWTVNGSGVGGNAIITTGNIYCGGTGGIKTDNYRWANGVAVSFEGTYSDANVRALLPSYSGNLAASKLTTPILTTGSNLILGELTGNWTLSAGSKLNATYADLAERFHSDAVYDVGTVVELGGSKEVTAVKDELSNSVFGVVSNTAAYLMNSSAGNDETHPPIALSGRVKVKVVGLLTKGQRLVSAGNGIGRGVLAGELTPFNSFGRSLEDKLTSDVSLVEAIVNVRI